jgi:hypothetical protein
MKTEMGQHIIAKGFPNFSTSQMGHHICQFTGQAIKPLAFGLHLQTTANFNP